MRYPPDFLAALPLLAEAQARFGKIRSIGIGIG
jgi:hypothetical protein